jgi:diguanylate cyclase (GGDEF)-like protein/PAS domain S-box-containing protein
MTPKESVLRLVLVEDRVEDAEQIISQLRNGGLAVRPERIDSDEQLQAALDGPAIDLVTVSSSGTAIPLARVAELVHASGKDIPVLVIVPEINEAAMLEALKSGGARIALRANAPMLQALVRSEFNALETRRATRSLQSALRESERRCDSLIESSRDPIAYIHEGMHIRANQAYLEMFGFEEFEEVEGLSVLDLIAGSDAEGFKQLLKRLSKGEAPPKSMPLTARRSDGSSFEAVMEFAQATYEGERCLQVIFRQKEIDAEVVKELDALRQRDQSSGLFNRQHFLAELDDVVAAAANGRKNQAVLLIDIDSYGALLNEIGLGHADELLAAAARRLEGTLGDNVLAARFADHGFGVLLRDSDFAHTRDTAEAVRVAFDGKILRVGQRSLTASVSIGGVQIGEKIASTPQVLTKAGQSLQAVGALGGNRIEIYDPAAKDRAEEERFQERIRQVEEALETGGFVMHYQPIISLHGDVGECYEVLLRMQLANGDLVPPLSFLPEAESEGLTERVDRWVIGRSIAQLAERKKSGKNTRLFVNITTESLLDARLPALIQDQLKKAGVEGDRLVLEIPESKCVTHLEQAQRFQREISRFGASLSLEQFGSSGNSFQLLAHIDASYLRIDRALMGELAKSSENQKKVREIADRARDLGKKTIAEFVQDAASMTVLFTSSVTYVCGNFLAPAGPQMNYDFSQ